ncbi:MAG TPA: amidohydrolase family protein, partial [Blastocatellia bacterium]
MPSKSELVRRGLDHPVIDSDGHVIEFEPAILSYIDMIGGARMADRFKAWADSELFTWYRVSVEERRRRNLIRPVWWGMPAKNTLDRATATLPKLLYERLPEFGFDYAVLYPTLGLPIPHIEDDELRRVACRAFNTYYRDWYGDYQDRFTTVALIPMHTPEEAIDELEHAVLGLKAKACMFAGYVIRPLAGKAERPRSESPYPFWLDTYGLDSAYDYDPLWQKCVELKVSPGFHSGGMGWGSRTSISNFMYNRIGHFAAAAEAVCKSLFMGGVSRRFPELRFAFLECGVGWACALFADLVSHWEKRNVNAVEEYNPARLDRARLLELYSEYGSKQIHEGPRKMAKRPAMLEANLEQVSMRDEWAPCKIEKPEDIRDLFVPKFFFGCEADDPISSWAFNRRTNPFKSSLKAIFSSDIGHWDVP